MGRSGVSHVKVIASADEINGTCEKINFWYDLIEDGEESF